MVSDDGGWWGSSFLSTVAGVKPASLVWSQASSAHIACASCSSEYRSWIGECVATLADGCRLCRCDDVAGRLEPGVLGELGARNEPAVPDPSDPDGGRECRKDHLRGNS